MFVQKSFNHCIFIHQNGVSKNAQVGLISKAKAFTLRVGMAHFGTLILSRNFFSNFSYSVKTHDSHVMERSKEFIEKAVPFDGSRGGG
jgi:hypothetical protein